MPWKLLILLAFMITASGCSIWPNDRCYLAETRYLSMKTTFEQTGSYQRVGQLMDAEQWSDCEINQFRYRLRKDLGLEGEDFDVIVEDMEPAEGTLEFYPGTVKE